MLGIYLLFGMFLGTVNPPITNTAVSGMPRSMTGVAASLASVGRQTGTTLGVAIAGTVVASALARGGPAFTSAAHSVWWLVAAQQSDKVTQPQKAQEYHRNLDKKLFARNFPVEPIVCSWLRHHAAPTALSMEQYSR